MPRTKGLPPTNATGSLAALGVANALAIVLLNEIAARLSIREDLAKHAPLLASVIVALVAATSAAARSAWWRRIQVPRLRQRIERRIGVEEAKPEPLRNPALVADLRASLLQIDQLEARDLREQIQPPNLR